MKTWVIVALILIFIFVVVPLLYYGITAATLAQVVKDNPSLLTESCPQINLARPPSGKAWACKNGSWELVSI